MILTGPEIIREWRNGRLCIKPFSEDQVNPNSYNFRLGDTLRVYENAVLDPRAENPTRAVKLGSDGFVLEPRRLYLANTEEVLGSCFYAPTFSARSSVARMGMFINLSAALGDIGFIGQWTLQLFALNRVRVYQGMKIGQMMFWRPQGKVDLYNGKYQGSRGPQPTLIHQDYATDRPASAEQRPPR